MLSLSHTKSWAEKSILLLTTFLFVFFFQLENKACVNCHESITDAEAHTAVCNGGSSGHQQLTIPLLFEHADLEQPFDTTQKHMIPLQKCSLMLQQKLLVKLYQHPTLTKKLLFSYLQSLKKRKNLSHLKR